MTRLLARDLVDDEVAVGSPGQANGGGDEQGRFRSIPVSWTVSSGPDRRKPLSHKALRSACNCLLSRRFRVRVPASSVARTQDHRAADFHRAPGDGRRMGFEGSGSYSKGLGCRNGDDTLHAYPITRQARSAGVRLASRLIHHRLRSTNSARWASRRQRIDRAAWSSWRPPSACSGGGTSGIPRQPRA